MPLAVKWWWWSHCCVLAALPVVATKKNPLCSHFNSCTRFLRKQWYCQLCTRPSFAAVVHRNCGRRRCAHLLGTIFGLNFFHSSLSPCLWASPRVNYTSILLLLKTSYQFWFRLKVSLIFSASVSWWLSSPVSAWPSSVTSASALTLAAYLPSENCIIFLLLPPPSRQIACRHPSFCLRVINWEEL